MDGKVSDKNPTYLNSSKNKPRLSEHSKLDNGETKIMYRRLYFSLFEEREDRKSFHESENIAKCLLLI